MESDALHVREYHPSDLAMVSAWWSNHNTGEFPSALLPPLGVVVERGAVPQCALWLYMAVGVGVCFAEYPVSTPGLSLAEAREGFSVAIGALEAAAKANDYGVMICNTLPPIARVLRGMGFSADARPKTTVVKLLNHGC